MHTTTTHHTKPTASVGVLARPAATKTPDPRSAPTPPPFSDGRRDLECGTFSAALREDFSPARAAAHLNATSPRTERHACFALSQSVEDGLEHRSTAAPAGRNVNNRRCSERVAQAEPTASLPQPRVLKGRNNAPRFASSLFSHLSVFLACLFAFFAMATSAVADAPPEVTTEYAGRYEFAEYLSVFRARATKDGGEPITTFGWKVKRSGSSQILFETQRTDGPFVKDVSYWSGLFPLFPGQYSVSAYAINGYGLKGEGSSVNFSFTDSITRAVIYFSPPSYTYDGTQKKPTPVLWYEHIRFDGSVIVAGSKVQKFSNGSTDLVEGTHYDLTYSNNINAGTATVTITGKGYFTGTVTKTFTINKLTLTSSNVVLPSKGNYTYNGNAQKPSVSCSSNYKSLIEGTDYTITCSNNINAGTATATIVGQGNYAGTVYNKEYFIDPYPLSGNVSISPTNFIYSGNENRPSVYCWFYGTTKTLTENTDYTATYSNNTNAGAATITITGKGNYSGSETKPFTINRLFLDSSNVTISPTSFTYDGAAKQVSFVYCNGNSKQLTLNTDYVVTYSNNVNAGTATMNIEGRGNYYGSVPKTFPINQLALTSSNVTISPTSFTYDGTAKEPSVYCNNKLLVKGTDYTTSLGDNINAGTVTITITGKGNYSGSVGKNFTINQVTLTSSNVTISPTSFIYDGTAKCPSVYCNNKLLVENTDYTIYSIINNTNVGTGTIVIKGENNYAGTSATVSKDFTISNDPDRVRISEVIDKVTRDYIPSNPVTGNINLPTSIDGVTIAWTSSKTSVISNTGVVTRQASDTQVKLTGTFTLNGKDETREWPITVKAKESSSTPVSHPADTNKDWRLVIGEVTSYISSYKKGTVDNIGYVTKAISLYKGGETYHDNTPGSALGQNDASRWANGLAAGNSGLSVSPVSALVASAIGSNTATRAISGSNVSLAITLASDADNYAVEELLPVDLTASNINEGGVWDSVNNKVKWVFLDGTPRTLSYTVSGPDGSYPISGVISVSGDNTDTGGASQLVIGAGPSLGNSATRAFSGNNVTLTITLAPEADSYAVEELLPAGLTASNINEGGVWDPVNNKVKWVFLDGTPRTLSYTINGESVSRSISGVISVDGVDTPAGGVSVIPPSGTGTTTATRAISGNNVTLTVTLAPAADSYAVEELLPAGLTATNINEGGVWDSVNNKVKWVFLDATPRTLSYTVVGEIGSDPISGVISVNGVNFDVGGPSVPSTPGDPGPGDPSANSATRAISGNNVTLAVTLAPAADSYAVEELLPAGLTATNINEGGSWDSVNNKVKWVFLDATPRTLSYTVNGPAGSYTLSGVISVNGENTPIGGSSQVVISSPGVGSDNEAISNAKKTLEERTFEPAGQADISNIADAKAFVVAALANLELNGVEATVKDGIFTAPVAGNNWTPGGTNGSYTFTVELRKGSGAMQTTKTLTLVITATAYDRCIFSSSANSGGTVTGSGAGSYPVGSTVTITAVPSSGYRFVNWTVSGIAIGDVVLSNGNKTATLVLPSGTVSLKANFEVIPKTCVFSANVSHGGSIKGTLGKSDFATDSGVVTSKNVEVGAQVSLSAVASSGYSFAYWTADGITLANPSNSVITFSMPSKAVKLRAWFVKTDTWDYAGVVGKGVKLTAPMTLPKGTKLAKGTKAVYIWRKDGVIVNKLDKKGNYVSAKTWQAKEDGSYLAELWYTTTDWKDHIDTVEWTRARDVVRNFVLPKFSKGGNKPFVVAYLKADGSPGVNPQNNDSKAKNSVVEGEKVRLTVGPLAEGSGTFIYRWYKNNTKTLVKTTETAERADTLETDVYWAKPIDGYFVTVETVARNANGVKPLGIIKSEAFKPEVILRPEITEIKVRPDYAEPDKKKTVTLTVKAKGTAALNYQWFKVASNGTEQSLYEFKKELKLKNVSAAAAGKYRVKITNAAGKDYEVSRDVTVHISGVSSALKVGATGALAGGTNAAESGTGVPHVGQQTAPTTANTLQGNSAANSTTSAAQSTDEPPVPLSAAAVAPDALAVGTIIEFDDGANGDSTAPVVIEIRSATELVRFSTAADNTDSAAAVPANGEYAYARISESSAILTYAIELPDGSISTGEILLEFANAAGGTFTAIEEGESDIESASASGSGSASGSESTSGVFELHSGE